MQVDGVIGPKTQRDSRTSAGSFKNRYQTHTKATRGQLLDKKKEEKLNEATATGGAEFRAAKTIIRTQPQLILCRDRCRVSELAFLSNATEMQRFTFQSTFLPVSALLASGPMNGKHDGRRVSTNVVC
jgi:hypothetical protein